MKQLTRTLHPHDGWVYNYYSTYQDDPKFLNKDHHNQQPPQVEAATKQQLPDLKPPLFCLVSLEVVNAPDKSLGCRFDS